LVITNLSYNIKGMVDTFKDCYLLNTNDVPEDRFVKWKNNNHSCVILNVDGVEKKKILI